MANMILFTLESAQGGNLFSLKRSVFYVIDKGYLAYDMLKFPLSMFLLFAALVLFGNGAGGWGPWSLAIGGIGLLLVACNTRTDAECDYDMGERHRFLYWIDYWAVTAEMYVDFDLSFLDTLVTYRKLQHAQRERMIRQWCRQRNDYLFPSWRLLAPAWVTNRRLTT